MNKLSTVFEKIKLIGERSVLNCISRWVILIGSIISVIELIINFLDMISGDYNKWANHISNSFNLSISSPALFIVSLVFIISSIILLILIFIYPSIKYQRKFPLLFIGMIQFIFSTVGLGLYITTMFKLGIIACSIQMFGAILMTSTVIKMPIDREITFTGDYILYIPKKIQEKNDLIKSKLLNLNDSVKTKINKPVNKNPNSTDSYDNPN